MIQPIDVPSASTCGRLLVLDDDADVGAIIAYIAEQIGIAVETVQTNAAFETALNSAGADVVILDLLMPDCDGIEVLHRLNARNCRAGIILSSGVGSRVLEAAGRTALELGLDLLGTLPKPFSPRALRSMLQDAFTRLRVDSATATRRTNAGHITLVDVEAGLLTRQFEVHYQPKIHCVSGQLTGFEALVRWRHPTLGLVSPDLFLPLIEANALVDRLTDQILDQALHWFAGLGARPALCLAINLSPRSLSNIALADEIEAKCLANGVDPASITLEITEASAMDDPIAGLALTTRFCMKAFKLSIDDFGVGYSSLAQLARLPFAELKVDRQFVRDLPASPDSRAIVEAIVLMSHRLGLSVTAEGVESLETLKYLSAIGCDNAQGYAIASPMDASSALTWMDNYRPPRLTA
ncbi:EAL domain-containing response regulator [Sandarakinorhabdus oryzae]|uniref:EAL domain-containing response regulator n=1 Tax=Sandarakinorhabdus oryzae TaxID=2675220 RepID=UPI0012E18A41|nr:EAL domain-containing response regulator [Sandarakinorhabdus oryzae]